MTTRSPAVTRTRIIIHKSARVLELFDDDELVKSYEIALGFQPMGDKQTEGDGRTPEGEFFVFAKNEKSKFYLSLGLSYPSAESAKRGLVEKLISRAEHDAIVKAASEMRMPPQKTRLGGEIYIHGGGTDSDWTKGCIALNNEDIKELFDLVAVGTSVLVVA